MSMEMETQKPIIEEFKKITHGLLFLSEADYPFHVYCCNPSEPVNDYLFKISDRSVHETIEETSLAFLFKNFTYITESCTEKEKINAEKYKSFLDYLTNTLSDIKVFKIGENEIDIFIVGQVMDGDIIIVTTKAKES